MQRVAIYVDYQLDESYTPSKISLRAGSSQTDLQVSIFWECTSAFPQFSKFLFKNWMNHKVGSMSIPAVTLAGEVCCHK